MKRILEQADHLQNQAWDVIRDTDVVNIWSSVGATANLVGSLKTGLLIKNRDIDFHIYTDPFSLADSFSAIARLAENQRIRRISYTNLIEAEDQCIEWHAWYEHPDGETWQMDMVHILPESPYVGYFENVAERISQALTEETRNAILAIKHAIPDDQKVMSILVYQAVLQGGVRDVEAFWQWKEQNPDEGIVTWMP